MSRKRALSVRIAGRRHVVAVSTRYSRFVGVMKWLLPLGAVAIAALVVAWPYATGRDAGVPLSFAAIESTVDELLYMTNARFLGADDEDQPFSVTADSVSQEVDDPDILRFIVPKADILLSGGTWFALTADRGTLDRAARTLVLDGAVNVFSDEGYELRTQRAEVDLRTSIASGDSLIEGQGPLGVLNAARFEINRESRTIRFDGGVRLVLYPKAGG
ncbi:MAG: LPS export ABC transporter periplasmic protein LptC [Alphaproteobacteria bacterium]